MAKEKKSIVIRLRVSETEKEMILQAAAKMHRTTGAKPTTSRVILHSVKNYIDPVPVPGTLRR